MAKTTPLEMVIKVEGIKEFRQFAADAQSAAWLEGMTHALTWLGLKQYADVMAKDNPHGKVSEPPATGFPPRPLRKDKVG